MKGKKIISEVKKEIANDEYEVTTITRVVDNVKLQDWLYDYILDIGDVTNYESYVYCDIQQKMFFDVDEVISYCEDIISSGESHDDYEVEKARDVIKLLDGWRGWMLFDD